MFVMVVGSQGEGKGHAPICPEVAKLSEFMLH